MAGANALTSKAPPRCWAGPMAHCSAPSLDGAFCGGDRESDPRRRGGGPRRRTRGNRGRKEIGETATLRGRRLGGCWIGSTAPMLLEEGREAAAGQAVPPTCHVIKKFAQRLATFVAERLGWQVDRFLFYHYYCVESNTDSPWSN